MTTLKTTLGTYDAIKAVNKTCNFIGRYSYILDGEEINGYESKDLKEDEFTPIVKLETADGWLICTNYKNVVNSL